MPHLTPIVPKLICHVLAHSIEYHEFLLLHLQFICYNHKTTLSVSVQDAINIVSELSTEYHCHLLKKKKLLDFLKDILILNVQHKISRWWKTGRLFQQRRISADSSQCFSWPPYIFTELLWNKIVFLKEFQDPHVEVNLEVQINVSRVCSDRQCHW